MCRSYGLNSSALVGFSLLLSLLSRALRLLHPALLLFGSILGSFFLRQLLTKRLPARIGGNVIIMNLNKYAVINNCLWDAFFYIRLVLRKQTISRQKR